MKRGGRPRRSEEQPDSAFGEALKAHRRRVKDFTQAELSRETGIPEKTLSEMVKGKRISGTELRRDLRAIIKALHRRKALLSLEEANRLITTIPAVSALDDRDPADAEIIALFDTPLPTLPSLVSVPPGVSERKTKKHPWRLIGFALTALVIILGMLLAITQWISSRNGDTCSATSNGVTLYTDINYQGHCHTFGPGDYELALYGLEQNVSSIKDWNDAYHITLYDKDKNFYYLDQSMPVLPAEWDNRADTIHIEKHRPTSCHPGSDGIIAYIDTDYAGGCLFITGNIPDLAPLNFDQVIVSIQFVGTYRDSRQLVIYKQPNYQDKCGAYWQDQSDLLQCARIALSVRVLPFTPPTPIPTFPGTHYSGNVAPDAMLSPGGAQAVIDGNLQTEWVGGHMVELDLSWPFPVTIHRIVVWDRKQSPTDNNQINKLKLVFSDGTETGSIDMISEGPRCADVTIPVKTVTWLHIVPVDASGNNGYREVEVWATTGPQYSNNTCVNKKTVPQTVPQAATTQNQRGPIAMGVPLFWSMPFQRRRYGLHYE